MGFFNWAKKDILKDRVSFLQKEVQVLSTKIRVSVGKKLKFAAMQELMDEYSNLCSRINDTVRKISRQITRLQDQLAEIKLRHSKSNQSGNLNLLRNLLLAPLGNLVELRTLRDALLSSNLQLAQAYSALTDKALTGLARSNDILLDESGRLP